MLTLSLAFLISEFHFDVSSKMFYPPICIVNSIDFHSIYLQTNKIALRCTWRQFNEDAKNMRKKTKWKWDEIRKAASLLKRMVNLKYFVAARYNVPLCIFQDFLLICLEIRWETICKRKMICLELLLYFMAE